MYSVYSLLSDIEHFQRVLIRVEEQGTSRNLPKKTGSQASVKSPEATRSVNSLDGVEEESMPILGNDHMTFQTLIQIITGELLLLRSDDIEGVKHKRGYRFREHSEKRPLIIPHLTSIHHNELLA